MIFVPDDGKTDGDAVPGPITVIVESLASDAYKVVIARADSLEGVLCVAVRKADSSAEGRVGVLAVVEDEAADAAYFQMGCSVVAHLLHNADLPKILAAVVKRHPSGMIPALKKLTDSIVRDSTGNSNQT